MNLFLPQNADQLRWLLKEKYRLPEATILDILSQKKLVPITDSLLKKKAEADAARLAEGEPLAYVIGWVDFLNCRIDLSLKPLIPRPETEYWVNGLIKEWKMATKKMEILDLCCGSGCIGIALLKNLPQVKVTFSDISADAVKQTEINLHQNAVADDRWQTTESDLFQNLSDRKFDVIISNPPYVDPNGQVSPSLKWEPSLALFAQNNGLSLIEEILLKSKKYLNRGGELILEFGKGQEKAIEQMAKVVGWSEIEFYPDQYEVIRWGRFKL